MKKRICILLFVSLIALTFSCEDSYQEMTEEEVIELPSTEDDGDEDIVFPPSGSTNSGS